VTTLYIEKHKRPIYDAFEKLHPKPHTSKVIMQLIEKHMREEHQNARS